MSAHFTFAKREMGASSKSHAKTNFMAFFFAHFYLTFPVKSLHIAF
jgi:hypothetical protein